jgi:Periplasmic binding protein
MNSPPTTAALTLSLTGPYERQGTEAAEGVRLWAEMADVQLTLVDDGGSRDTAVQAYTEWIDGIDLLIGPIRAGWSGQWPPWSATPVGCCGTTADPPTISRNLEWPVFPRRPPRTSMTSWTKPSPARSTS